MDGYLGETVVDKSETEYKDYTQSDLALMYIECYGGISGEHHKNWVLDQVARILMGTNLIYKIAKWDNGHLETRFSTDEPSQKYLDYVKTTEDDGYEVDVGIAP